MSSPGRTDRSSSTPASTRTRMRTRRSAASPSPIRRRRPPTSTELRSPSPIHSSRSRNPPRRRRSAAPPRPPASSSAPPPPVPQPAATALVVAPGKALTALKADDCPNPTVAGKPVRIERADAATGLAMLAGDFASNGEAPRLGAPAQDLVILGFSGPRLAASSASFTGGEARPVVTAAVDKGASGGPVFDRRGALVGLVAPIAGEPKRVAGVALAAPHPLDRARRASRLSRRQRTRLRGSCLAQRGRHRRPREEGAGRRLLSEIARRSVRDHAREDVLLQRDQHAEDQRQDDAVPEGAREHDPLVPAQIRDRDARRDILRRDHLAHDAAR